MGKYLLGIDGGGSKTHACIVDLDGNILATAANGGANWERIGVKAVQKSLSEIVDAVCLKNGKNSCHSYGN
jgi:N-acetylglucosamine kinase-like BadF-type ATPase